MINNKITEYNELYNEIINVVGKDVQEGYFYEEVGELLQALNHYKRGRCTKFHIIDELIDVQITLDILKIMFEMSYEDHTNLMFLKTEKLKKNIKKYTGVDLNK